jgi:AcrR family transcriptional regulator
VARAAAAEMLRRTEPDPSLAPVEALRSAVRAFVDYVEENPDNYKALVRGAASGDTQMRAIFDETRARMAQRVCDVVAARGVRLPPRAELSVHGWVAYAEECVIRWLDDRRIPRAELLDLLTASLPVVVVAAAEDRAAELAAVFSGESPS